MSINTIPMAAITRLMDAEAALQNMVNDILTETDSTKVEDEGKGIAVQLNRLKDDLHKIHCEWEADRNAG